MRMVNEVMTRLLYVTPNRKLLYVTNIIGYSGKPNHNLEHLACFFPGLLALGVHTLPDAVFTEAHVNFTKVQAERLSGYNLKNLHLWAAIGLGETCWRLYADQPTGLSPEFVWMVPPATRTTSTGLWIDALDSWNATVNGSPPPGADEKTSVAPEDRDYRFTRTDYLLRPEVCQRVSDHASTYSL